jgi:quercetin dioxygenase-like cupin family protein
MYELLVPNLHGKLVLVHVHIPAGFDNRNEPFKHYGEECSTVISGSFTIYVGSEAYELHAGDSITYDSSIPHSWVNHSGHAAEIISAATPPHF